MSGTWGGFQSLIQLSVALNAAFAAFGTYSGSNIKREKARFEKIRQQIVNGAQLPPKDDGDVGGEASVLLLEGKCESLIQYYDDFVNGRYRIVCVLFSALGIPVLIYSSYRANDPICYNVDITIIALYLPFLYGLWQVISTGIKLYTQIYRKRIDMERRINRIGR